MNAYFFNIGLSVVVVGLDVVGVGGGFQEDVTVTERCVVELQTVSNSSELSAQSLTPLHLCWGLMQAP